MGIKTSEVSLTTDMVVQQIGRALQSAFGKAKAESIEDITSASGALSNFDDRAIIEVVGQGSSLMAGHWAVQAYVFDRGESREIVLIALGDGGFTRAMNGGANTLSLARSIKKRDLIANSLR